MKTELAVCDNIPKIPSNWNYEASVKKMKLSVSDWKVKTIEIVNELWAAREILSVNGNRWREKTWGGYCQEIGINKRTANKWIGMGFEIGGPNDPAKTKTMPHVSNNSGENEWYTPPEYIKAAKDVMGAIDFDPASSKKANKIVEAKVYCTKDDDGRSKKWGKRVWMNPPYAQPLCSEFCSALIEKVVNCEVDEACILVNNATETVWFQELIEYSSSICFIKGRVKFLDPDGNQGAPLQGQAIIYIGKKYKKFIKAFGEFGKVLING